MHQQDIQAFVKRAVAGRGDAAISLQGQRLISTSGVKRAGSTVVLQGVPYSTAVPGSEAVGEPAQLSAALDASPGVQLYRRLRRGRLPRSAGGGASDHLEIPAFDGRPALS